MRATFCVVVCLLIAVAGCDRSERAEDSASATTSPAQTSRVQGGAIVTLDPKSPESQEITIAPVTTKAVPVDEVIAPARVIINPNRISRVLPFVQGRVLTVLAKLGDAVTQGQPLVTMDSPDADAAISAYLQAQATARQTKVTLAKADADLERARDLFRHKAVAEKDVRAAENDFATAQTAFDNARANTEQTRRKLELLGLKPADLRQPVVVRAPISGVITDISVTPGEFRAALSYASDTTAPLMTVADLSTVWIASDVPESMLRFVHVGDRVSLTLVAYPGETFTGRVARIGDILDPQTRTLKVYVEIANPRGRFHPEMFGTIRQTGESRTLPVIPTGAVIEEYGKSTVFVERAPGQFERRQVALGARSGDVVAVTRGLKPGDRIIVDGAVLLKER